VNGKMVKGGKGVRLTGGEVVTEERGVGSGRSLLLDLLLRRWRRGRALYTSVLIPSDSISTCV
jgi:hypothetical protein